MKKTPIRFLAILLAGAASAATTGAAGAPAGAGAPAAPGAANSGATASPAVSGAATPLNPNAPPPGAAVNPSPAQTQPPVMGAATPLNPNAPPSGAPAGPPSNATLNVQVQPGAVPVAGQVPTMTIANAILNPTAPQTGAGQSAAPASVPGALLPINVQNLNVARQNGALVLTGTVQTQADKDAAGLRAAAASGGETVLNNLVVQ